MKQLSSILWLLLLSFSVFSQSANLHINPFTLIDFAPRWRTGVEYDTNPGRFAYNLDIGYGNYAINRFRLNGLKWDVDYQFIEIRPEIKYFFATPKINFSLYTGIELLFLQLDNTFKNDYYEQPAPGQTISYDEAFFHKRKYGSHVKYGMQYLFGKLVIDNSLGIGIMHRNRFLTDAINAQEVLEPIDEEDGFLKNGHRKAGKSLIWHLTFNLKVGFVFWEKKIK